MGWRPPSSGYLYVFVGVLMSASQTTVAKLVVTRMGVFSFYVFVSPVCALVAFAFYFALNRGSDGLVELRGRLGGVLVISVFLALNNFLMSVSLGLASASDVIILFYIYPIVMVGLDFLVFGGAPTRRNWLGLALGFLGVVVFATGGTFVFHFGSPVVDLLVLVASVSWVLYLVLQKKYGFEEFSSNGLAFLLSTFYPLPFVAAIPSIVPHKLVFPDFTLTLLLLYFGVIGSLGNIAYVKGLKRVRAVNVALLAYLTPTLAILLNWVILGEKVGWYELAPLLLIFLGYVIINSDKQANP